MVSEVFTHSEDEYVPASVALPAKGKGRKA